MIIPDVNLLVHAYNTDSPVHEPAKTWWESVLSNPASVGLPWACVLGFIRIATHPRVFEKPLRIDVACAHAESWLAQPQVALVHPGDRHATIVFALLRQLGSGGNLTTDAHLAALAIEYQAELNTTDADFARFSGLRYRNPMKQSSR